MVPLRKWVLPIFLLKSDSLGDSLYKESPLVHDVFRFFSLSASSHPFQEVMVAPLYIKSSFTT